MPRLTIIVAATRNNGLGYNGYLPWRLPKEMAYFARVTSNAPDGKTNAVIMGRNTWNSIPTKFRPLVNRLNLVTSRNTSFQVDEPASLCQSLEAAITHLASDTIHRAFIIGGASLYDESLTLPSTSPTFVDRILLTRILSPAFDECDVFMSDFLNQGDDTSCKWRKASHQELEEWVGFNVPNGIQSENSVEYEFQMWLRM